MKSICILVITIFLNVSSCKKPAQEMNINGGILSIGTWVCTIIPNEEQIFKEKIRMEEDFREIKSFMKSNQVISLLSSSLLQTLLLKSFHQFDLSYCEVQSLIV